MRFKFYFAIRIRQTRQVLLLQLIAMLCFLDYTTIQTVFDKPAHQVAIKRDKTI